LQDVLHKVPHRVRISELSRSLTARRLRIPLRLQWMPDGNCIRFKPMLLPSRSLDVDAHLIGIDLAQFLPVHNASATKERPTRPAKPPAQSDINTKEPDAKPH
jgi:hypothetical protein